MGVITYPTEEQYIEIRRKASEYEVASRKHTLDFVGFEDDPQKPNRIYRGRLGQEWLILMGRLNGLMIQEDESGPEEVDEIDLGMGGKLIDVKTGKPNFWGQVSPVYRNSRKVDWYCFLESIGDFGTQIIPHGFIPAEEFWSEEGHQWVANGEYLPGTTIPNRFAQGSAFVQRERLRDFEETMLSLLSPYHEFLQQRGLTQETAEFWGLHLGTGDMWGRVVFPIHDAYGEFLAWCGRSLGKRRSKYWNEPYNKTDHLFGLYQNKRTIWEQNSAMVVEGPLDVMHAWQEGQRNVVATMGIALSLRQAELLVRYTERVVLVPDNDEAGEKTLRKRKAVLEKLGLCVEVQRVKVGKDLDECIKNGGNLNGELRRRWEQLQNKSH